MHASDQCPAQHLIAADKPEQKKGTLANPFSVLGKLKQTDR
jgi:hypothetical protein